ncbi:MAG: Dam family site-specific DNA-(adenine-N6)-methyltransferase [Planctomycetaceae bacterium]|jgi:DNA adenine methylase|nr:Dam family site-specific DNA-(adenine-N6)-methyltransferase [Planctomycetaceae bacterium]
MIREKINRSPLFYIGDKYKLVREIKTYFPDTINRLIEPFVGGGSIYMNVYANGYLLNDINTHVVDIHRFLCSFIGREENFYDLIFKIIHKYGLSCSYEEDIVPTTLKQHHMKTYYARFNKEKFNRLKTDYNHSKERNIAELYILLIYGFNRMIRFNSQGDYNLPVGNIDFNQNVYNALSNYFSINATKRPRWFNQDFRRFLGDIDYQKDDLIYLDPPYLITFSEYNKLWNETLERDMLQLLDHMNKENIKFAVSNVTHYKGKENSLFIVWSQKYNRHPITSNYISYHDSTIKKIKEVLVTNF